MSTDMHVSGIVPADETYKKMKTVYDACKNAGIAIPKQVAEFFDYSEPNGKGLSVELPSECLTKCIDRYGIDIEIDKIPKHIKIIRCEMRC